MERRLITSPVVVCPTHEAGYFVSCLGIFGVGGNFGVGIMGLFLISRPLCQLPGRGFTASLVGDFRLPRSMRIEHRSDECI